MRNRCTRLFILALIAFSLGMHTSDADAAPAGTAPAGVEDVRLGVIVVVDQMRSDLLTRYWPFFGDGGFKRLVKAGAWFPNTYLTYGASSTAAGHATIATGRLPRQHGIINNEWYLDPEIPTIQHAAFDKDAKAVGLAPDEKADGYSPRYLIGATLGDGLKLADKRSRVFSVSLKHRAAIMLGGQNPDGAYWLDRNTGKFMTSTWYRASFPPYLVDFNEKHWTDRYLGQTWDKVLPESAYASCHPVDPKWIAYDFGMGAAFPHKMAKVEGKPARKPYDFIYGSPFGNESVLEVARRLLVNEKLGQGPARDLLCVSFSANDIVGHAFGPNSAECLDMTVRTDRVVAELLSLLDQQVGLQRCAVVLTGDHGVKQIPQLAAQARLEGANLEIVRVTEALEAELVEKVGPLEEGKKYILGIQAPWLWLDFAFRDWDVEKQVQVLDTAADFLSSVEGISAVFTAADLEQAPPPADDVPAWLAWRSYCPGRSGQIYIHLDAFWYEADEDGATGHGTGHSEDRHVPLLLAGPGVKPGRYAQSADLLDIAPTLAMMFGIEPPNDACGRVLHEAFVP